jgi:hypothetical protein
MQSSSTPRPGRVGRRIAAGALMTTVFVGATAGTALAADTSSAQVVTRSSWVQSATVVPATATTPATDSISVLKATVNWNDPQQGEDHSQGKATRIAVVWAVAAAVVMATMLGGAMLNRRR